MALLAAALLLLGACAEPERVMRYGAGVPPAGERPVWPAGRAVPRYVYAGELTGEANFPRAKSPARAGALRLLAWLAGLGLDEAAPVVLQRPQSGVVDARGRVYVTDVSRQAVFVFDQPNARLLVWERATDSARFVAPIGIALGAHDELIVADAALGAVFRLGPDGTPRGAFGAGLLERPTGVARDAARGRIYVADTRASDIKVFDDSGELIDFFGGAGEAPGRLNAPTHIAFAAGRLYVTDTLNSRVQVFDREGDLLTVFGKRGLYVGNLARPKGIAVDDEGNIYVVESYYDHLLVFDADGRFLLPIGGTGRAPGQFYLPAGVWVDGRNRVYVADMFNGRVSIFQFLGGN